MRYRIDGVLYEEHAALPLKLKNAVTSRIKIMASLDISERRLPQDGRIKLKLGKDKEMDFRVSVLPTLFGEKIVMRLLDKSNLQLDMTKLGFEEKQLADFMKAIHQPYGMVLVTGPTGSGKTTTLYSALQELNKTTRNISTAEDPVEYNLMGINQVQMHEDVGLNFATALRAFLRQDPNIIMVGEIRDFETGGDRGQGRAHRPPGALDAAHQRRAVDHLAPLEHGRRAVPRHRVGEPDPGAAPRAQDLQRVQGSRSSPTSRRSPTSASSRTSRRSCSCSRAPAAAPARTPATRAASRIYEVMPFTEPLKELVLQGASTAEVKAEAIRGGMKSLRMAGIEKLIEGITTVEEVLRVSVAD